MAFKCKQQGVSQYIYKSTCAVWGIDPCFGEDNVIDNNTLAKPKWIYGISKNKGEDLLLTLNDKSFRVAVLRLPNVCGANCPGRFYHRLELLSKLFVLPTIKATPFFSLIIVENVSKAITNVIIHKKEGILTPQDPTPLSIVDKLTQIARDKGRVQYQTNVFSPLIHYYSIVSCPMIYYDENGDYREGIGKGEINKRDFLHGSPICHAPSMIRTSSLKSVGGYVVDKRLLRVEDYNLWMRMYAEGYKAYMLPEALYKMRDDRNAKRRRNWRGRMNEMYVMNTGFRLLGFPWYCQLYALRPLLAHLAPEWLYNIYHRKVFPPMA